MNQFLCCSQAFCRALSLFSVWWKKNTISNTQRRGEKSILWVKLSPTFRCCLFPSSCASNQDVWKRIKFSLKLFFDEVFSLCSDVFFYCILCGQKNQHLTKIPEKETFRRIFSIEILLLLLNNFIVFLSFIKKQFVCLLRCH